MNKSTVDAKVTEMGANAFIGTLLGDVADVKDLLSDAQFAPRGVVEEEFVASRKWILKEAKEKIEYLLWGVGELLK
jgi:hypothetical protein